jgi:hypothetical protein
LRRVGARCLRATGLRRAASLDRQLAKLRAERDTARAKLAKTAKARDGYRDRSEALAAELADLRSAGVPADRDDLAYVFIVTYGRSGSTLLQGVLSSTPGVVIRGENGGALRHLFEFHRTVTSHRDRLARPEPLPDTHPWWGIDGYPDETALRELRRLLLDTVLRPTGATQVVGFKEIDWPLADLPALLDFTRAVFPGARFVLNTRNLDDVAASKWWAGRPDARARLEEMEQAYVAAVSGLGDAGYHVHYDDYVADPGTLRGLFEWLGLTFDEQRVRTVMAVRHSY